METLDYPATQVFDKALGSEDLLPPSEQPESPDVKEEIPATQPDPMTPPNPQIAAPSPAPSVSPATKEMMFGGQVGGFQITTINTPALFLFCRSPPTCFQAIFTVPTDCLYSSSIFQKNISYVLLF